jgi:DNA-binding PadR family transcriptional regulator
MHGPWNHGFGGMHGQGRWARGRGPGDPWSDMWSEWWRGPVPRAERGTVRWLVLDAIAEQPRHGYEIIQSIGDKSGGAYKPSPGVIYPTLQMLEELGHARTIPRDERKVYEITDDGRRELAAHQEELTEFYEGQTEGGWENHAEEFVHVAKRVKHVAQLFKRAMHRGGIRPTTMRKARKVLDEALQKLEELLSQEDL